MNRVLIVDDDNEMREMISLLLEDRGYSTDGASSGEEAIEKTEKHKFDIVLLDLVMPGIKGMDTLVEIRKTSPLTRIIIITSFASVDTAVEATRKGASDYISKPFKIEELDVTIKKILEELKFGPSGKNIELDNTLRSLSSYIRREIVKLIDMYKGMRLMEISRILDIEDHTKVFFHLRILRDSGIIEQRNRTYFLTKEGSDILTCLNILENHLIK